MSDKERDPHGKNPKQDGAKLDAGKPSIYTHFMCYFPRAIRAVTLVSQFGAIKYTTNGWVSVPNGVPRYSDALARHLVDEAQGLETDDDSDLMHAAQTAWNSFARLELMLRKKE